MRDAEKCKTDLDTPCLILDLDVLERNLQKMQDIVTQSGKNIRPHVKTHKCSTLAQRQIDTGALGVCAAKLSEAEGLVKAGINDVLITGPVITAQKVARLVDLVAACPSLMAVVDHPDNIDLIDDRLGAKGISMNVLIDIDVGLKRTGVRPSEALALAEYIADRPNLQLQGIQAYAGHIQHIQSYEERKSASTRCLNEAVPVFRELSARVPTCTIFSASGTGTFQVDLAIPEVTEHQVGSYVCMDTEYLGIGSAGNENRFTLFDPALRLLTTVVSANHDGFATVDAGLKSLYKDGGIPRVIAPAKPTLTYDWFGDEYGRVSCAEASHPLTIGTVLELVTSHCDPTINLFDRYYLTKGQKVVGDWPIDLRGCCQ